MSRFKAMSRQRFQTSLFPVLEFAPTPVKWSVASFALAMLVDDCGHAQAIRPVTRALRQALENIKARRDPAMHLASFDIHAGVIGDFYIVAFPESIPASVAGMIERKLMELPSFVRLKRGQIIHGSPLKPFGYYEAGAIWVLETTGLRGEAPFAGQGVAVRYRLAATQGADCQMAFDYAG